MHGLVQKKPVLGDPKSPVLDHFSENFPETSVYVEILEIFLKNFNNLKQFSKLVFFLKFVWSKQQAKVLWSLTCRPRNETHKAQSKKNYTVLTPVFETQTLPLLSTSAPAFNFCFCLHLCLRRSLLFASDIANQFWQSFFVCRYQSQRFQL